MKRIEQFSHIILKIQKKIQELEELFANLTENRIWITAETVKDCSAIQNGKFNYRIKIKAKLRKGEETH